MRDYISNPLSKREKMVLSGSRFERIVATFVSSSIPCSVLLNKEFMSPRLHRGLECDLIVITSKRIYCVECKNYSGYIAGDMFDYQWRFASSSKIGRVQNPYLLNKKRIRTIRGKFYSRGISPPHIENVIVVPDKCRVHVDSDCNVYNLSAFIESAIMTETLLPDIYNVDNVEKFLIKVSNTRDIGN